MSCSCWCNLSYLLMRVAAASVWRPSTYLIRFKRRHFLPYNIFRLRISRVFFFLRSSWLPLHFGNMFWKTGFNNGKLHLAQDERTNGIKAQGRSSHHRCCWSKENMNKWNALTLPGCETKATKRSCKRRCSGPSRVTPFLPFPFLCSPTQKGLSFKERAQNKMETTSADFSFLYALIELFKNAFKSPAKLLIEWQTMNCSLTRTHHIYTHIYTHTHWPQPKSGAHTMRDCCA